MKRNYFMVSINRFVLKIQHVWFQFNNYSTMQMEKMAVAVFRLSWTHSLLMFLSLLFYPIENMLHLPNASPKPVQLYVTPANPPTQVPLHLS